MIELSGESNSPVLKHLKTNIIECDPLPESILTVIRRFMQDEKEIFNTEKLNSVKMKKRESIYLDLKNTSKNVSILINKDEFILGKNISAVDGVIDVSNTISRVHCRIIRKESGFFIQDLHSSNHTYVNGRMLSGDELVKIQPEDVVRMAEIEFLVKASDTEFI